MKVPPIRVFACGHERADNIRAMFNEPFQQEGDVGYCRECMTDRIIVKVKT